MDDERRHADLTADEARVLGCLIEKEATTPDNYPLTVNSLRNACNQSTSRDPVMELGDRDVERALAGLRERGLTRTVHSTSNRATKFRHVVPDALGVEPAELALIAVLMLRGPQTVGELKGRTERQHTFESVDAVVERLGGLADRGLVRRLDRRPGQKDARWIELLSSDTAATHADEVPGDAVAPAESMSTPSASSASPTDPYAAATAEFYDLLATTHWESFGLQLLDLLSDADPANGPIVDVGAGTGVGLAYLSAAVPGATIRAIEPSRAMRTALHARLHHDEALRAVTTVDPRPWATAAKPERACALVVSAALGHLADAERHELWRYIADHLPPGAPAVVEVLPPHRPVVVERQRYRSIDVGDFTYEGWQQGTPLDDRHMAWTMQYLVLDRGDVIAEYEVTSSWRCFGVDDIRGETERFGLELTQHGDCVVLRPAR